MSYRYGISATSTTAQTPQSTETERKFDPTALAIGATLLFAAMGTILVVTSRKA